MIVAADRHFDSAGVPIRYVELGAGEPVVLAHSYTGSFDEQFVRTGVAGALAREWRVVGFDLRGHGGSGKPHDAASYGVQMALDIVRLLDHLRIAKAHAVGYSLGAHVVAQVLTLHPGRFASAVLGGSCGRRHWSADDDRRVEIEAAEMEAGSLRSQIARLRPAGAPPLSEAEIRDRSTQRLAGSDVAALAAVRRSNRDQLISGAALAAVDVPVLGVVGSDDPYIESFRTLARAMPQLGIVVIDGATHNSAVARPEFVDAVARFLRANAAPS